MVAGFEHIDRGSGSVKRHAELAEDPGAVAPQRHCRAGAAQAGRPLEHGDLVSVCAQRPRGR
jgi:hypothetical protein